MSVSIFILILHNFVCFSCIKTVRKTYGKRSYSDLPRSVSEPQVVGFVRAGSPAGSGHVTRPYRVSKRAQSRVVLAQQIRSSAEGKDRGNEGAMCPSSHQVCVPTSRISERYVVDSLPARVKSVPLPVAARDTAGDVYSVPYLPRIRSCRARNLRAPFLPVSTQLCILIGARAPLLSRRLIDRGA